MQAVDEVINKAKGARARKDADKQEATTKPLVIKDRIEELVHGYNAAKEAAEHSSEAIKKAAEDSGYNSAAVRKFVVARAGESYEEKKRDVEQQLELFDNIGLLSGSK